VTFEALGTKSFKGTVAAISPTGTTTQGVVGYPVPITLSDAGGVRPGMTATAQIVTDQHDDVVLVANKAVTRSGSSKVVQVVTANGTESRAVQTGLSNDQNTEITSGLSDGDTVVVSSTTTTAKASVPGTNASAATGITSLTGGSSSQPPAGRLS
jgi:macrolide-specific efflux system membrane fusion protein